MGYWDNGTEHEARARGLPCFLLCALKRGCRRRRRQCSRPDPLLFRQRHALHVRRACELGSGRWRFRNAHTKYGSLTARWPKGFDEPVLSREYFPHHMPARPYPAAHMQLIAVTRFDGRVGTGWPNKESRQGKSEMNRRSPRRNLPAASRLSPVKWQDGTTAQAEGLRPGKHRRSKYRHPKASEAVPRHVQGAAKYEIGTKYAVIGICQLRRGHPLPSLIPDLCRQPVLHET